MRSFGLHPGLTSLKFLTGLPDLKSGRIPFLKILDAILGVQDAIFEFYGTTLGRVFFLQVLALFYLLNLFEEFKKKIGKV